MRSPRPPPRRAHLCCFTICGLFTKKFELFFKGSAASAPTRLPRYLYRLSLRPRKKVGSNRGKIGMILPLKKMQKFKRTQTQMTHPVDSI
jgi:hypothetical protein